MGSKVVVQKGYNDKNRLYKLIKLLRVPRLFELLNVERIR